MTTEVEIARRKSVLSGLLGVSLLIIIYLAVLSFVSDLATATDDVVRLWYWLVPLVAGFGVQVGLYVHIRQTVRLKREAHRTTGVVAATGGFSTASMIACCAHHATDVLPILGLTAVAAFLSGYQSIFLLLGIVSNIIGITYMLSVISRHGLFFEANRWLASLASFDYRRVFQVEIPVLIIIAAVGGVLIYRTSQASPVANAATTVPLAKDESAGNGIWVDAAGLYDRTAGTLTISLRFTTHSGSLDFEVPDIVTLRIDGKTFPGTGTWRGSPPGGHHRYGELRFTSVPKNAGFVELTLSTRKPFGTRTFTWKL